MVTRGFPVVYARDVERCAGFYESLGFERTFQLPEESPGYISLKAGMTEMGIVSNDWAKMQYDLDMADGPRFEMFLYVDDVDTTFMKLREGGAPALREPDDMPWGERVAFVQDPEGNPVALARPVDIADTVT